MYSIEDLLEDLAREKENEEIYDMKKTNEKLLALEIATTAADRESFRWFK